jgi:ATP-binding cassette, subfamily B, bacterial
MSADRPKGRSLRPLKALGSFLAPHRRLLILALLALVIASAAMLAVPVAVRFLIDHGMQGEDPSAINRYFIGFLAASIVFGVFAALRFYLVTVLGERVVADVRAAVFQRVVQMDTSFFEVTRTGEVLSRLTADTTLVQSISGVGISITLRSALNLVGALVMMAATSPKLMGVMLLLIPVILLPIFAVGRRVRGLSRDSQDRIADASAVAGASLYARRSLVAPLYGSSGKEFFGRSEAQPRPRHFDRGGHFSGHDRSHPGVVAWGPRRLGRADDSR